MHRLLKAIVVEDNEVLCRLFAENLRADPQITTAEAWTLSDGLNLCHAERQLVLLVDLGLPDCHGVEAVPALRKAVPGATLIAITGDENLKEPALAAGAHSVIIKGSPESHGDELVRAVRTAVMKRDLELLNAPASVRMDRLTKRLDAAGRRVDAVKKLLPAIAALAALVGSVRGPDLAAGMRHDNEVRAIAWWEGLRSYSR